METVNESDREMSDSEDEEEKKVEQPAKKKAGFEEEEEDMGKKRDWSRFDDSIKQTNKNANV